MFLIPTTQAEHLAKRLASRREFRAVFPGLNRDQKRAFLDGEVYARIPEAKKLKGQHVVVLHAGAPHPNEGLQELELILQILRDSGAKPVDVFFSYFPYGMQDKVFDKGETNVAENLTDKLVSYYRVRNIYIIDAHFWGRKWAAKYPIRHSSALPLLVKAAAQEYGEDLFLVSPDIGSKRRTGVAGATKKRFNSHAIEIQTPEELRRNIRGKTVGVVDDLIQTGGTLVKLYEECRTSGAKNVLALISHGLLKQGITRVQGVYPKVYLTNTINRKAANVDVSPLIAQVLLEEKR